MAHTGVNVTLTQRGVKMGVSDIQILVGIFLIIATGSSYYIGRKQGILDAVNSLERLGIIELEDEENSA